MKSSFWLQGSFSRQVFQWCDRFGAEAAEVRHELFYLAAGRTLLTAGMRAFVALLRDTRLLLRYDRTNPESGAQPTAILLATLPGANGWETLQRSLPVLRQAGYRPLVLAHPRVKATVFAADLEVLRPARVDRATLSAAARVFIRSLLKSYPLLLACCLSRRRLWRGSLQKTLCDRHAVLVLHNDFDMMSRAALGHGIPAICLQHGIPTDEFFPTRADWYLTWGASSRRAFEADVHGTSQLIEDALGRGVISSCELSPPEGLSLLSQTHANVLGEGIGAALKQFAASLTQLDVPTRILLHPQEQQPYERIATHLIHRPPHPELQRGGCAPRLVIGYCSSAMIDAALAGHWVVALQLELEGNLPARNVLAAPLRAETAEQVVMLYRRLQVDADFRGEVREAQTRWLRDSFSQEPGGLSEVLDKIRVSMVGECSQ